jgi:UDP-N-acetylglucosamine--N-acetylmuramyl-(pentapeptide) pyrophosphoryl-undecaprenol N-acetylglucosamine transferase
MPLLSLAHELKKASKDSRLIYIGLKGETLVDDLKERYKVFDEVYHIPAGKFRRYHGESLLAHLTDVRTLLLNIRDFFKVLAGVGYSLRLLGRIGPDVVFSKGGFVAVPVGLAAAARRVPIVTHDSDVIPGLANRIIGRFAVIHATGMPSGLYTYPESTMRYVGIPLDERIRTVDGKLQADYKRQLGLPEDSLVLLVGGAGLGSKYKNDQAAAISRRLLDAFQNLHIIHISGNLHLSEVKNAYKTGAGKQGRVTILGFTPEFYKYSGAADVVVTRAGATVIAELAAQQKAVILIPAPHLTSGHQLKNAAELAKARAVKVVDNSASPDELLQAIMALLSNKQHRSQLANTLGKTAKRDAAEQLADILLQTAQAKTAGSDNHA